MEYNVTKLPDTYVTKKIVYAYVPDPDWMPDERTPNARPAKVRTETVVEEKGGWLFTFMRGHQIRCTSLQQIELLGLTAAPRLIDDSTGLQVNAQGIPLDIQEHVKAGPLMDGGGGGDTVDSLMGHAHVPVDDPINSIIDETE